MAKLFIEDTTLSSIGDAIREKGNTTELINPLNMADAITNLPTGSEPVLRDLAVNVNGVFNPPEGIDGFNMVTVNVPTGDLPEEVLIITGDCFYRFAQNGWNWFINMFGNQITTNNIISVGSMFRESNELNEIPFDINGYNLITMNEMFSGCSKLKSVPYVIDTNSNKKLPTSNYNGTIDLNCVFSLCYNLREIPNDWFWKLIPNKEYWDAHKNYTNNRQSLFNYCFSLRELPDLSMLHTPATSSYSSIYYYTCYRCYTLNKIENFPVCGIFTSNAFQDTFQSCSRLKDMTFETNEDGTPKTASWSNQVIDLSYYCGYGTTSGDFTKYNSGITVDKDVYTDATYQALKDDPDWFATDINYSRYNRISAVNTINTLPDTSAFLATNGGTNTIKFLGTSGTLTDGGAINTMTAEEIAVATAKGWTVSLV